MNRKAGMLKEWNTGWENEVNWDYLKEYKFNTSRSLFEYLPEELKVESMRNELKDHKIDIELKKIEYEFYEVEALGTTFVTDVLSIDIRAYLNDELIVDRTFRSYPKYFEKVLYFISYADTVLEDDVREFFEKEYKEILKNEKIDKTTKLINKLDNEQRGNGQ